MTKYIEFSKEAFDKENHRLLLNKYISIFINYEYSKIEKPLDMIRASDFHKDKPKALSLGRNIKK